MGKKNDTSKPAFAVPENPTPKATAKPVPAAAVSIEPPAKASPPNGDGASTRIAIKKKPAKAAAKKAPVKKPVHFSNEDIALRAYFISEHRQRNGIHGDEHSDWIEAQRQLRLESRKKAAKKSARPKKRA
jgi:hypothetical protein